MTSIARHKGRHRKMAALFFFYIHESERVRNRQSEVINPQRLSPVMHFLNAASPKGYTTFPMLCYPTEDQVFRYISQHWTVFMQTTAGSVLIFVVYGSTENLEIILSIFLK